MPGPTSLCSPTRPPGASVSSVTRSLYFPLISVRKPASGASNLILATRPLVLTITGLPGVCGYRFVRMHRQADQRQRREHLQHVSPILFVAGHKHLLLSSTLATELIAHAPPGG